MVVVVSSSVTHGMLATVELFQIHLALPSIARSQFSLLARRGGWSHAFAAAAVALHTAAQDGHPAEHADAADPSGCVKTSLPKVEHQVAPMCTRSAQELPETSRQLCASPCCPVVVVGGAVTPHTRNETHVWDVVGTAPAAPPVLK